MRACVRAQTAAGFRIGHIGDMHKHSGPGKWDAQLPAMEEVKAENLRWVRGVGDMSWGLGYRET